MKSNTVYTKEKACIEEGWEIENGNVWAYGQSFPITDPITICLKVYRTHSSHETRYQAMKRAFELLWPQHVLTYHYWMERIFREHCNFDTEIFTLAGGAALGKAVSIDTKLRSPTGWIAAQDVTVGTILNDTEGGIQTVLGVYPQGIRDLYTITFSDNTSVEVDEDHLWTVYSKCQRNHSSGPQTITTKQILKDIQKNFSLPNYQPVAGVQQNLPIDPYVIGVLIGNGSLTERSISAYISNEECLKRLQSCYEHLSIKWIPRSNCWRVGFLHMRQACELRCTANSKYIPAQYLIASKEQRLALLQGLLDTDGYASKTGAVQYITVSEQLKTDVLDLARGLGFICTESYKIPTYTYKGVKKTGQKAYTITIQRTDATKHTPLFTAKYKLERSSNQYKQYRHRRILSVTYSRKAPAVCFKVSHPNQLFFINDYVVTHNTQSAAYVACLFWLALPHKRAVIVTSTELASLKNRIYGYVLRALQEMSIQIPLVISNSPPPSIRYDPNDFMHGIFGVAAKEGNEDKTIESIKGRHPKDSLLLVLDEATDMPIGITTAVPNLRQGLSDRFQAMALGNSKSWTDLHGAWSYPKVGIENIDPKKDFRWETTQPNGICLYFNPYDSPAIHETDPVKKAALSKFLITEEKLLKAEQEQGIDSDGFWQFVMGFWRSKLSDPTIITESFLKNYDPTRRAEFSGKYDLAICAGLDPAFSVGGDKCVLRLGVLGHHVNGKMVLDFRGEAFVFVIKIFANTGKSAEIQIADQVIEICARYGVPLNTLCVDASGAGRGLADVIQLRSGGALTPTKIYSTNIGNRSAQSFDTVITSAHDMWFKGREFITHGQVFGMDALAYGQLHTRLVIEKNGKKTLERKPDYKKRMSAISSLLGRSPDEADSAMLCLQSAIIHHGFFPGQVREAVRYLDADSMKFDMAVKQYKEMMQKKSSFVLKASYKNGLDSIINKKMF